MKLKRRLNRLELAPEDGQSFISQTQSKLSWGLRMGGIGRKTRICRFQIQALDIVFKNSAISEKRRLIL